VKTARAALVILSLTAMAFALAARRGPSGSVEIERQPPPLAEPSAEPTAASFVVKVPRSTEAELERGMRRAFGAVVQPARTHPGLVGDFNGDGAEDLAMAVRPAEGRLSEINDTLANWIIQDALEEPASRQAPSGNPERARATVDSGDVLLAVVHGVGEKGWRDEDARQCYLVRHATGAPLEALPRTELRGYVARVPNDAQLTGHVILCASEGRPGIIYWTGARYAWHPLPSRRPSPPTEP
jgi:hypothetical protein